MQKIESHTITVDEIGGLLGISRASAYNLARSNGFPSIRIGRRLVIPRDAFNRWMEKQLVGKDI